MNPFFSVVILHYYWNQCSTVLSVCLFGLKGRTLGVWIWTGSIWIQVLSYIPLSMELNLSSCTINSATASTLALPQPSKPPTNQIPLPCPWKHPVTWSTTSTAAMRQSSWRVPPLTYQRYPCSWKTAGTRSESRGRWGHVTRMNLYRANVKHSLFLTVFPQSRSRPRRAEWPITLTYMAMPPKEDVLCMGTT